jgi:hypothetical protein
MLLVNYSFMLEMQSEMGVAVTILYRPEYRSNYQHNTQSISFNRQKTKISRH